MKGLVPALVIGVITLAIFSNVLVIIKENDSAVLSTLKSLGGHHWIGQGIVDALVFIIVSAIVYFGYTTHKDLNIFRLSVVGALTLIVISGVILVFYVIHA